MTEMHSLLCNNSALKSEYGAVLQWDPWEEERRLNVPLQIE
jgi:hypothetical protein